MSTASHEQVGQNEKEDLQKHRHHCLAWQINRKEEKFNFGNVKDQCFGLEIS